MNKDKSIVVGGNLDPEPDPQSPFYILERQLQKEELIEQKKDKEEI